MRDDRRSDVSPLASADGKGNCGCNAATGEYGDMIEFGILDPTDVTRSALQNAASMPA